MNDVRTLDAPGASTLFSHPLRRKILAASAEPISATALARRLGETRQKVNYHVRELADAGLLEPAGEVPKRGLTERLYRASARAFVVGRDAMGELTPDPASARDAASAGHLVALAARTQDELARVVEAASAEGSRVATLSLDATVRFTDAVQRAAFTEALAQAVTDVVARFSEPESSGRGRPFRLVVGAYPPPPTAADPTSDPDEETS